jgi:hypothetical protein
MDALKFIALDKDDLEVVSAHLQDANVNVADILWLPGEKRIVLGVDRFDWLTAAATATDDNTCSFRRARAGLRFERVFGCKYRGVARGTDAVLNLLAVDFAETDAPAGVVTLTFAGGAAIRLEVECLEAELADLEPVRTTSECPIHLRDALNESQTG